MRIEVARGRWLQVGLPPNPVAGYEGDEIGDAHTAGKQGAFLSQEFVTAGKLRLAQAVVSHEVRQAEHDHAAWRQRVLNDVHVAYDDVLAAQRGVEVAGQLVRIGEEGLKAAEKALEAKEFSRVDVLGARIETASARLRLDSFKNRHEAAWQRLAGVLGQPHLKPARLAGSLEDHLTPLTWEEAWQELLARSPELARAQAGVARARCAVALQCARRVPNVELQLAMQHDNASGDDVARLAVGVPLPLFNRNQGNIAQSQAELTVAQEEVRRVELDLHERLAAAMQRYRTARQEVETYQSSILPDARASLGLVRRGYELGQLGYLALLTAQRTYFNAELSCLESLRQLHFSSAGIRGLLLGSPGGGDALPPPFEPSRLGDLEDGQTRAVR